MKTMKRILSGILGISMLAGLWTAPVYAQSEVDFFATFENYEGTGIPEGFSMWNYANGSTYASRNQAGNYGGEEASKGVHILTDSVLVYNFDSVMKTGKLNISFDLKSDDLTNSTAILLGGYDQAAAGTTDNPYDWTEEGESTSNYTRLFNGQFRSATIEGTKLGVYTDAHGVSSCKEYPSSIALTEGFHKYEYEFDLDNSRYTAYVDGTKFADNLGLVKGVKAFIIRNESSAAPSLWVDNFCVYTGTKNLKMAAETANVAQVNGKVNVGISQVSDLSAYTADTFTAKHKVTGDSVKPTSVAVHKNGFTLTFASLSAGDYELSNSLIDNKTYFSVVSGVEAADADAKYTYLNDSLTVAAEGTLPTGWVAHSGYGTNIAADAEGGMKSAKGSRQDMRYVFPEIIHSGRTVFEFDVKAEQGANPNWGIGLIRQEQLALLGNDLTSDKIKVTYDNDASLKDTWTRKIQNILVGSNTAGKVYFNNTMGADGKVSSSSEYAVTDDGKYHNVKFVLDMDAACYEISIDGAEAVKQNYTGNIFGWKSVSWADGTFDWYQGIVGLRLLVNDTSASDVSFRNIKVYRESSDNDNHVLTKLGGGNSDQLRTVWFAPQLTYHAAYEGHSAFGPFYTMGVESAPNFTFMNSTGNTGSQKYDAVNYARNVYAFPSTDGLNVIADIYQRNTVVHHYFDVPVKAGKAFTVEFDIKEDKCSASIWNINLLDENDMIARPDNWTGTKTPYGETANATDGNYWYQNVVLSNWGWNYGTNSGGNGIWLGDGTKREAQSRATYYDEDEGTYPQIPWTDATWHNVKLHIVPGEYQIGDSKYYTKYEITVTVGDVVYSTTQYFATDRFSATDTYGMALWQRMINDDNANRGNTYMKNLRVYEDPAVDTKLAAVASVTAVSADGTENTVNTSNSVIPSDTTEVRVNMTEALAENVSAYITLANIAGTVSDDGKSYVFDTEGKLAANAELTLNVSDKTPFDENSTVLNEAFSLDMTVADDADTKVFEFTLKEKIVPNNIFVGYTAPEYWNDTTIYFGNEKEKKLVLEGYNSDEATTIAIMTAVYSTDEQGAEILEGVTYETIDVPTGSFSKTLTEFASAENADKLKAFVWLYPSMEPIAVNIG